MAKTLVNIFIVLVILFSSGVLPKDILSYIPDFTSIVSIAEVVEITQPGEKSIEATKGMAKEILEKVDYKTSIEIAVFNDEFAAKIDSYKDLNTESKYLINMYTSSYKKAFGKFENLSSGNSVSEYINSNILSKEKFVTNEEIDALKDFFRGLAWNLIVKEQKSS